ncbi:MAG: hypothetical protein ACREBQ_12115, partial [Nitrososphaerales archaeon]
VVFGLVVGLGILPLKSTTQTQTTQTTPPPSGAYSVAALSAGYGHFGVTSYVAGSNFSTLWDAQVSGAYQQIGTNTQTISIQPSYGGVLYAVVTIPSGQSLYVDPALTKTSNSPLVTGWNYISVSNNGINNYVFTLTSLPGSTNPISPLDFYPYFIHSATQTLNKPANDTSVGTSSTTQFLQWATTVPSATANVGSMIKQIVITVNSTSNGVFQLNSVNDPATYSNAGAIPSGLIQGGSFSAQQGSTNYVYTYNFGSSITDFSTGQWVLYGSNSLDNFPYTLSGIFNFGAASVTTNCLSMQIQITVLSPAGTLSTLTNTAYVMSGSVC